MLAGFVFHEALHIIKTDFDIYEEYKMGHFDGKILPEPCAEVVMTEHGESALKLSLRAWCATSDYWTVKFETTEKVKAAFDREGIEIPFPQLDVHLDK